MLFDTHAHYDDQAFDADRRELLSAMPDHNVGLIVNPGCTVESSRTAIELAAAFPHVYAAVGIHPENCGDFVPAQMEEIRALAQRPKVVAVGEIGLDYYWPENPPRELQQEVLRRHMALAQELALPVIIHDREAHADCLAIVREFPAVRGVFHCFSGSAEMARELLKRGWMLSFNGAITFKIFFETYAPHLDDGTGEVKEGDTIDIYAEKNADRVVENFGATGIYFDMNDVDENGYIELRGDAQPLGYIKLKISVDKAQA